MQVVNQISDARNEDEEDKNDEEDDNVALHGCEGVSFGRSGLKVKKTVWKDGVFGRVRLAHFAAFDSSEGCCECKPGGW